MFDLAEGRYIHIYKYILCKNNIYMCAGKQHSEKQSYNTKEERKRTNIPRFIPHTGCGVAHHLKANNVLYNYNYVFKK